MSGDFAVSEHIAFQPYFGDHEFYDRMAWVIKKERTPHKDGQLTSHSASIDRNEKRRNFTGTPGRMSAPD